MSGYDLNDPCHPTYHDRMSDYYDMRDRATLVDAAKGLGDLPIGSVDHGRDDAQEDAWRRESEDVARTCALVNLRHHGTVS